MNYKMGSNQFKRRPKIRIRGYMATVTLLVLVSYGLIVNLKVFANEVFKPEIVSPLATNQQIVISENIPVVTPTPDPVNEFMATQAKINQKTIEWMKTQEVINSVLIDK